MGKKSRSFLISKVGSHNQMLQLIYDQPTLSLRQLKSSLPRSNSIIATETLSASIDASVATAQDYDSHSKMWQQKRFSCGSKLYLFFRAIRVGDTIRPLSSAPLPWRDMQSRSCFLELFFYDFKN